MKKRCTIHFLALAVVNVWVLFAVRLATWRMGLHWDKVLPGQELAGPTTLALQSGTLWPALALLAGIVGLILAIWSKLSESTLFTVFCAIVVLELAIAALHMLLLILPSFSIMYGLSGAP